VSTTAAATTWTASSAAATLSGLVDANRSPIELGAMQLALSLGRIVGISKGDESKTPGTPSLTISDDLGVSNLSKSLKVSFEGGVISGPGEATYEKLITHICLLTLKMCTSVHRSRT